MESQEDTNQFKKNDVVFAICNNELPWPAQISKIINENFHVKFIGHKSTAVVHKDKIIPFENQYIGEIVKEYKKNNENAAAKVMKAIEDSRNVLDKIKRKEEREANRMKKPKKAKENKVEKPKVEKSIRTRNHSRRTIVAEQTEVKVQAAPIPSQQPIQEVEKVSVQKSASHEANTEFNHQISNEQSSSMCHVGPIQLHQKEVSPISSMVQELKPFEDDEQYIEQNSYVSQPENNEQDNPQNPDFSVTSNQQLQIVIPIQDNQQGHHEQEFQQDLTQTQEPQQIYNQVVYGQMEQYDGPVVMSEMKRFQPTTPVDFICMYLQKMINYLGRLTYQSLNKQEKQHLAELLMNNRKVHDEPRLLDHMVRFIEAFDFKLKQERKKCFIEYIKIKERVECCLVFRSQMTYDQEINKILDRYVNRFNQQ